DHAVLENEEEENSRFSISFDLALTAPPATAGDPPEYLAPHPGDWDPAPGGDSGSAHASRQ
ncbi:MAG: hypothetical protein ACKOZW_10320, partial [Cyanobium sp.]